MASFLQLLSAVFCTYLTFCVRTAAPRPTNQGDFTVSCTPRSLDQVAGSEAEVNCNFPSGSSLDLPPQQQHSHVVMQGTDLVRFVFRRLTLEHNRRYCLTASSTSASKTACFHINVRLPSEIGPLPDAPPRPTITDVITTESSISYGWTLSGSSSDDVSTEVRVESHDTRLREHILGGNQRAEFTGLRAFQQHTIRVRTTRGSQTLEDSRTVLTAPELTINCPSEEAHVELPRYQYGQSRPSADAVRLRCTLNLPLDHVTMEIPEFLRTRVMTTDNGLTVIKLTANSQRTRQVDLYDAGMHCLNFSMPTRAMKQYCFGLTVHRPPTATIRQVCHSDNCASRPRKTIGCYVTGSSAGEVTWTYNGQALLGAARPWLIKASRCRSAGDVASGERLCKLRVHSQHFLSVDPTKLKCHAQKGDPAASASGSADLVNGTDDRRHA